MGCRLAEIQIRPQSVIPADSRYQSLIGQFSVYFTILPCMGHVLRPDPAALFLHLALERIRLCPAAQARLLPRACRSRQLKVRTPEGIVHVQVGLLMCFG